ncbi:hypothetical protein ACFJIV_11395 [Mucilaginibacter sp. UC70_90]
MPFPVTNGGPGNLPPFYLLAIGNMAGCTFVYSDHFTCFGGTVSRWQAFTIGPYINIKGGLFLLLWLFSRSKAFGASFFDRMKSSPKPNHHPNNDDPKKNEDMAPPYF